MPTRPLPNDPSFEHLRKHAKRLHKAVREGDADALAQVREFHPRATETATAFALADAQLVIARSHGFASWTKLKRYLVEIEPLVWNPPVGDPDSLVDRFLRLACLTYGPWHRSNPSRALHLLADHPELADANISTACAVGNVEAVRAAIDREPRLVNAKGGPLRWAPLVYACYSRMETGDPKHSTLETVRLLLARGADPGAGFLYAGRYAFTALTGAFGRGEDWDNQLPHPHSEALARLLLEAGADPNDGQTLYNRHFQEDDSHLRILFASGLGQNKGGRWLERLADENANITSMLVQQLCWAAIHNFPERVKLLLEHGVDPNVPSRRDGRTAYEAALRAGHEAIADYLLQHGAKKIELDPVETFALACIAGRREAAKARLADDPTLLERLGHEGRVDLLDRALVAKSREGLRLIVELGVDINGMVPGTGLDRSVLHGAAGWADVEMVAFLITLGADPNLRDPTYHSTPLGWAFYGGQREVVQYLLPLASIFDAVWCGGVERVAELLTNDPALARAADEHGNPLVFHLNPRTDRLREMVQLLAAHGAEVNVRDGKSRTLVDRAIEGGWTDYADVLRSVGGRTSAELE